jgi:hypothetical protein
MTDTPNLGLPYIDGSQAQKHVTHNEALRILDAVVQIGVLDRTRMTPPPSPADGDRHVVASSATDAWAGKDNTIATWQDGAWAFLMPKTGWCVWSTADSSLFVFDGSNWQSAGGTSSLDNLAHLGVNTGASSPNLLSVKSNAALFDAIDAAGGGTGDMRIQVSKESSANTASIFFSDGFSGRAEFGLVGADAFKLKVSPDGSSWTEAFNIDQASGNLTLPRGLALTGVVSPAQITADQDNYNPAGLAAASVLQISADAPRRISGLTGASEGRCLIVINVGGQPVTLLNESASSSANNRLTLGADLTISAKQAAILRYDGTAARWQAIAGGAAGAGAAGNIPGHLTGLTLSTVGSSSAFGIAAGFATDSSNADMMALSSAYSKTTSAWAVGSANGALDTGTIAANTWYHVFLVKRTDTGVVDVLISTSAASPTLPTNYTLFRRIGSMLTDGVSKWTKFSQYGDEFQWDVPVSNVSTSPGTTAIQTLTVTTPSGIKAIAILQVGGYVNGGGDGRGWIFSPDINAGGALANTNATLNFGISGGNQSWAAIRVRTNTSAQVKYAMSASTGTPIIATAGWVDDRGK